MAIKSLYWSIIYSDNDKFIFLMFEAVCRSLSYIFYL